MGRGSGALTWWQSFEVAKVAWHGGGGREGRASSPLPAKAERERGEGRGGGRRIRQQRPAESASPSAPGKPERGGADRLLPHGPDDTPPLPPPFFPANVYLNARAHTEIVRLFYPSGKKEQGVERKRRQSEELLGRALHSERATAGRGDAAATATATADSLSPRPCGGVCQWEREPGHSIPGTQKTFGRHCRGRQKRQQREGPYHRLSLLRRPGRPAQAARRREAGRSRGPGEARRGSPARGCGARGSLETTLPGDALGGLQGPPPRRARRRQ